jgi:hypothetical protein
VLKSTAQGDKSVKSQRVNLDLKHGLGHLIVTDLQTDQSFCPEKAKRHFLATLQLLEKNNWVIPTHAEIVALSDPLDQ